MDLKKFTSFLGLAKKAGKVVAGEFSVESNVKSGKVRLVMIAQDASDNTRKKFTDMCIYYHVDYVLLKDITKEELGRAIGCELRSTAAVTDSGFAKKLKELYNEMNQIGDNSIER